MKPIVTIPKPVLTTPAKRVLSFDKKLSHIIKDMRETLIHTGNPIGVGLAAPQVGIPLRIFLARPDEKKAIRVFINPIIIKTDGIISGKDTGKLEGCLSVPNIWGEVKRAKSVTISYQDEKGNPHEETITGFLAAIVQHETDHLDGILFTRRVIEQNGTCYTTVTDVDGKETLEKLTIA